MPRITLSSDSSFDVFPDNRIGSFRCKLPQELNLDRQRHKVGMAYVSWPHKLANIEDGAFKIRATQTSTTRSPGGSGGVVTHITGTRTSDTINRKIPTGYYGSAQEVVDALNSAIMKSRFRDSDFSHIDLSSNIIRFDYDATSDIVSFNAADEIPSELRIQLSPELFVKLGFGISDQGSRWIRPPDIAPHTADLDLGKNAIFIYCDILEPTRIMGNKVLPLLSIVPWQGEHGKTSHHEPRSIEYCDLRYDNIDEIQIDLRGDTGRILKFLSGKVFVTLDIKDKHE